MRQIPAFFYLYQYYALPEEFASAEVFLAAARRKPTMTLLHLRETACVAPYFIEEDCELVRLRIEKPDRIRPLAVSLLTAEEYAAQLTKITAEKCISCWYHDHPIGKDKRDDRAKEMTLDGLCLLHTESEKPYTLIDAADGFWSDLLQAEDAVRKPLFDGNLTEAADSLSVIYARHFACAAQTIFAVNRSIGQRYLMFGALSPEARVVSRYVISRAPREVTEYWLLFDHLPRGLSRYIPIPGYDLLQYPPTVEFSASDSLAKRWKLTVYTPPAAGGVQATREAYRWLCAVLGEDLLYTRAAELEIEVSSDYAHHRSVREFAAALRAEGGFFFRYAIAREFSRPVELLLPPGDRGSRIAPERMSTVTPSLSIELTGRMFSGLLSRVVDDWRIPVCTLTLTLDDPGKRRQQSALICGELVVDLQRDGLIALLDIAQTEDKLYLNFFATAGGETIEALRDLAPEFAEMSPTLTVRTHKETAVMQLNYTLDLIHRVINRQEVAYAT